MNKRLVLIVGLILILSSVLSLAGCGPQTPKELNLLVFEGYAEPEWVQPFEKANGVTINVTSVSSVDEMFSKMSADGGKGFDLVTIDTSLFKRYTDHNLIVPIDLNNVPSYKDLLPEFQNLPVDMIGGKVYGVPYAWGSMPLTYNADIVQPTPDSWQAMWDSKYKGKVMLLDEPQNSVVTMALSQGGYTDLWNFSDADFARLKEGFASLKPQIRTISTGATDMVDLMANKEIAVGIGWGETTVKQARDKGINAAMVIPKEGAIGWLDNWAISAGVQNKELAEKWISWVVSKDNSQLMVNKDGYNSTSIPTQGASYASRLVWLQPRSDYDRLSQFWNEVKLMLSQ